MSKDAKTRVPIFDGDNWGSWYTKFKDEALIQGVWAMIEGLSTKDGEEPAPIVMDNSMDEAVIPGSVLSAAGVSLTTSKLIPKYAYEQANSRARGFIGKFLSDRIRDKIKNELIASNAWKILRDEYSETRITEGLLVFKSLFDHRFSDNKPISKHISDIEAKFSDCKKAKIDLPEFLIGFLVYTKVPDHLRQITGNYLGSLNNFKDVDIVALRHKLQDEENLSKSKKSGGMNQMVHNQRQGRNNQKKSNNQNHNQNQASSSKEKPSNDRPTCAKCGKPHRTEKHIDNFVPFKKYNGKSKGKAPQRRGQGQTNIHIGDRIHGDEEIDFSI